MKRRSRLAKYFSIILAFMLIFGAMPLNAAGADAFTDVNSHWAKAAIERWSEKGVVKGYEGSFQPNNEIKRGDMAVILNNLMKYSEKAENNFADLKESAYYADAILRAKAAGVMNGSGNQVRPEDKITREEAAVMLCKALKMEEETTCSTSFKDQDQVSSWAKGSINALVNKGWLSGFEGRVNPKNKITRAEVVTILNKAVPQETSTAPAITAPATTGSGIAGPTIETTLEDGKTIKPSKLTFDVFAKNAAGKKINAQVTLNGKEVPINWNDKVKASYTLELKEGDNTVVVTAAADQKTTTKTYTLQHKAVKKGESTGYAVFSVELLTLGAGYLVEPQKVEIFEGENAAQALLKVLDQKKYTYDYTGKPEKAFYLAHIMGIKGKVPTKPNVPQCLKAQLLKDNAKVENRADENSLGEFDYTSMSGWMYSVNNVFPNVGFADTYLQDGDVVRVQFTIWGYGRDIGGADAMGTYGSNFYPVADKTKLLRKVAEQGYSNVSEKVKSILTSLNASQSEVDNAL